MKGLTKLQQREIDKILVVYQRTDRGVIDGDRLPYPQANKRGGVPPVSTSTGKFLRDDITWTSLPEAFPIGSVFISVVSTNPNTLLGYGTWAAFGEGRVLVGLDSGDTDFDTAEETGGAKTVRASAQTFGGDALASHQHAAITAGTPAGTIAAISATATAAVKIGTGASSAAAQTHTHSAPAFTGAELATHQHAAITAGTPAGTNTPGAATSVVQPYLVVYFFKRTA